MTKPEIDIDSITKLVLNKVKELSRPGRIPVGVSNRHIHLTEADYRKLFGDLPFVNIKDLTQPGEYASNRVVDVEGPRRTIRGVRILGPFRGHSQVELAKTDARFLGLDVPVRMSGDIGGTPALSLVGPLGQLDMAEGAIVAMRHIHMSPDDARGFGVKDGDRLNVLVTGERPTVFCDTVVRVRDNFVLEMHLDSDEANAVGGKPPFTGVVVKL